MSVRIAAIAALGALTVLAAMPSPAAAWIGKAWIGKNWASGTYIYTDLCTEGGERIGRRITLRRSPNGDVLTYEAAAVDAVRIEGVAFEQETRSVSFAAETIQGPVAFRGRMEADALTGLLEDAGGTHEVRLPRVLRSQGDLPCRGDVTGSIRPAR